MVEVKRLTISEVARRAGVAPSALRFYEARGLITSERTEAGHRRYRPDVLRRLAVISIGQQVGLSLAQIADALAGLPGDSPSAADWAAIAQGWRGWIDQRIALLERFRDDLDGCIGCGCLSLSTCRLYNPDDRAATRGSGPRYLLGDAPPMTS